MGLPIAIGTKNVSFYTLPNAEPIEEFADDGSVLHPAKDAPCRLFSVATSADQQLQAVVTVSYYDMLREDNRKEHTVAEIRVQVSPLSEAFSTAYRESIFRLPLCLPPSEGQKEANKNASAENLRPQAIFSSDRRFLTCLVPYLSSHSSNVVVFQLRKPRAMASNSSSTRGPPPVPSYIQSTAANADSDNVHTRVTPVATNPRVLKMQEAEPVLQATCLCDLGTDDESSTAAPSLLLVGCADGSILTASYRPVAVAGVLFDNVIFPQQSEPFLAIEHMDHVTEWHSQPDGMLGRLATIDSAGNLKLFRTRVRTNAAEGPVQVTKQALMAGSSSLSLDEYVEEDVLGVSLLPEQHELHGPFECVKWMGSYLALMETHAKMGCNVRVFGLNEDGSRSTLPVSTIQFSGSRLEESVTTTLRMDSSSNESLTLIQTRKLTSLQYDPWSDCLAISSYLPGNGKEESVFISLWHWRSNTQGLTIVKKIATVKELATANKFLLSSFAFVRDKLNATKLSDMTVSTVAGPAGIRKDLFETGTLSPSSNRSSRGSRIRQDSPILLCSESVSCPRICERSALGDYEVEYVEANIPSHYHTLYGAPTIAAIGPRWGRSVAIAAKHGVCTLDMAEKSRISKTDRSPFQRSRLHPKWYNFRNDTEANSFEVIGMAWWEGVENRTSSNEMLHDDILVAVVRVEAGGDAGYFLSCWSMKMLDLGHQLVRSAWGSKETRNSQWGLRLSNDFCPTKLDLLVQPDLAALSGTSRKAVVLVVGASHSTDYHLCQLQVVFRPDSSSVSYIERQPYEVVARCASTGSLGDSADLFVASASYTFDLEKHSGADETYGQRRFVATFGAMRNSSLGLNAIAISERDVTHANQVVTSSLAEDERPNSIHLSSIWMSDCTTYKELSSVQGDYDSFVWTLHLSDGKLLTWSLPFLVREDQHGGISGTSTVQQDDVDGFVSVHPKSPLLGFVCPAGDSARWMQPSASASGSDFPVGPLRLSSFSCMAGAGQSCHKLHRSLGENFESDIFRSDFLDHEFFCPGSFVLFPPSFLPSLYSLVLESASSTTAEKGVIAGLDCYLQRKLENSRLVDSATMALQLLALRVVEKATNLSKAPESSEDLELMLEMFSTIVDATRRTMSPLQFASLFLEVGRQIEPSCYQHLFPLPPAKKNAGTGESLETLFNLTLKQGSIFMAIAALPLFSCYETSRSVCSAIFHKCLARLGGEIMNDDYNLVNLKEEMAVIGDLFRYGIKLEDESSLESDSIQSDENTTGSTDESLGSPEVRTILCGLSRLFTPRKANAKRQEDKIIEAASSFIVNGFEELESADNETSYNETSSSARSESSGLSSFTESIEGVVSVAARYLVSTLLSAKRGFRAWSNAATVASILVGETKSGFRLASSDIVSALIAETKTSAFMSAAKQNGKGQEYTSFFIEAIRECQDQIEPQEASRIVDLVLILLDTEVDVDEIDSKTPSLILILFVAGHHAGRITDILSEGSACPITSAYLDATAELCQGGDVPLHAAE